MIALPWAKIVDIPFWQFQHWTLFHDKGAFPVCTCARARCTPTPSNIRYRYLLTELNNCPNFHIAVSKFPEIRGLAYCTRVARAQCIITPLVMHQRIALVELYQCTKFRVASSKLPKSKGAYAYSLNRRTPGQRGFPPLARAAGTPHKWHPKRILSWYGMRATCEFGIGGATRVPLRAARK